MPYLKRFVLCIWVISLVFLLAASMAAAETYRHPATGLVFPDTIAGMNKGKVTVFEQPELGVGIGYNLPGVSMTIFIYNLGFKAVPADVSSPVFKAQFDQAVGDIYQAGKMGVIENITRLPGNETCDNAGDIRPKGIGIVIHLSDAGQRYEFETIPDTIHK